MPITVSEKPKSGWKRKLDKVLEQYKTKGLDEQVIERSFQKRVKEDFKNKRDAEKLEMPKRTFSHGGEARVRGMGAAIKGGKFEGVF